MNPKKNRINPRRHAIFWFLLFAGGACLALVLLLLIVFGRELAREGAFRSSPPTFSYSTEQLFGLKPVSSEIQNGSRAAKPTSTTLVNGYLPLIPDRANLPPGLIAQRVELNRQFAEILRRIEEYEKKKLGMSFEETEKFFREYWQARDSLQCKIQEEIVKDRTPFHNFGDISARILNFEVWGNQAEFEAYSRLKQWGWAETAASHIYGLNEGLWRNDRCEQLRRQGERFPFVSLVEFDRATGYVDQQRINWCLQQQGLIYYIPITTHFILKRIRDMMDRNKVIQQREEAKHWVTIDPQPKNIRSGLARL